MRIRRWQWLFALGVLAGAGALAILWSFREELAEIDIELWVERIASYGPWPFFFAMSILPAFWIPVSPFLLLSGVLYPLPVAIGGTVVALSLNMAGTWLLAGTLFRPFFERLVARFGYTVPKLSDKSMAQVALMLRVTPGMPFPFQNYVLGLARMPFGWYMLVSVPTTSVMSISIILLGDAMLKGDGVMVMGAIALFVAISIVVSRVRQRLRERQLKEAA